MILASTQQLFAQDVLSAGKENTTNFFSDCGKSFVGPKNSLQSSNANLKASKLFAAKLHLMEVEILWKFNHPAAPISAEFGSD